MSEISEKIRYILQFYYEKGKNAAQARKKICDVYGRDSLSNATACRWFGRFRSGNLDVKDAPRSGRPITGKVDEILQKIEEDRHINSHDVARELNIDHKTVLNHLHKAGYTKKLDVWLPHELSMKNLIDRISISESLLKRNEIDPFLERLITGDQKWITYDNKKRKRSWSKMNETVQTAAEAQLVPRKVLLFVWWDWKGIVYHELLQPGQTIDSTLFCQHLTRLKREIEINRPELINSKGVVFHHDSAKPFTSLLSRQMLRECGWEILMHPPQSPDLAPSDYHLFRCLQNSLRGAKLTSVKDCENYLTKFFAAKPQKFYADGIMELPEKWRKVIDSNGHYVLK
ncbi:histone-lysine N-methyltransferase SETMAR-like [Glossina fuscipes fuscipes]